MPSSDYAPTLADVGNLLRARTTDGDGNELGTFTPNTTPTSDEAGNIIQEAVDEMSGRLGDDIPPRLFKPAKAITTLLAAMNVELTYYPEQVRSGKSAYEAYERRVTSALDRPGWLVKAVKDESSGGEGGPADDDAVPMFYFDDPVYEGEMVYDPHTQRWILRDPPPPSADEGPVLGVWDR